MLKALSVTGLLALIGLLGCTKNSTDVDHGGGSSKAKRVVLMRYAINSKSTEEREQGFLDALAKAKDIELLSSNKYGGPTEKESLQLGEDYLINYGDKIDGIFCPNESTASGMLNALEHDRQGLAGKIKFVGFDSSDNLVRGLKEGHLNAVVLQDPVQMGYDAVRIMVEKLQGKSAPEKIEVPEALATTKNMNDEKYDKLLHPLKGETEGSTGGATKPANPAGKKFRIAVIPKGTSHEFWKSVEAGARRAAAENGVEILFKGPNSEGDSAGQIEIVQNALTDHFDGICLAPLDGKALRGPVDQALATNVPVVVFDSGLDDMKGVTCFVATNNYHAGQRAGEYLVELLSGKSQ